MENDSILTGLKMKLFTLEVIPYTLCEIPLRFITVKAEDLEEAIKKVIPIVQASNLGHCYRLVNINRKGLTFGGLG